MEVPLSKYIVLVPLAHNDGTPVEHDVLLDFHEELFQLGGGYTIAGTVEGAYRMADGAKQIDHSLQYWVCIPATAASELSAIVARLGATLGQEAMYIEYTGSSVSLIPPQHD